MTIKKTIFALIFFCSLKATKAQEVKLASFFLIENNKEIFLNWTLDSGPTCNGITIWRSTDSINYIEVGSISGVCGSSSAAVSYSFIDKNPVMNNDSYYKIRMGYSQFSNVRTAHLKFISDGTVSIKPNPASDNFSIEFNNPKSDVYTFELLDNFGKTILTQENIKSNSINVDATNLNSGTYHVILKKTTAKIIHEKFIIIK